MASLTISHNFAGETGYIIAVPKKTTAPLSDVICTIDGVPSQTRKAYSAPHSQRSMLIEVLDPVWYYIKFYRSVDGTTLDEEILTLAGNALTGSLYPITKLTYVVNRGQSGTNPDWEDPQEGDQGIRDERLLDQVYWVEQRAVGTLREDEITDRSDDGGGFDFTDDEKTMADGDTFFAWIIEKVDAAPTTSGSSDFNDVVILTTDTDYDPSLHSGKTLIANWLSNIGILTIPNLSLVSDSKFRLQTHGGTQSFVGIQLDTGDTVEFLKGDKNVIWLGSGESIEIVIKDNVMYVVGYDGDYRRVGQRIWGDVVDMELNAIVRDGTQYSVDDLPRLVEWISVMGISTISEGTGVGQWGYSEVVDGETIYPNKGKFTLGGGFIRIPDDRDKVLMGLKNTDGTTDSLRQSQGAGGFQKNTFKEHTHKTRGSFSYGGYNGGGNSFLRMKSGADPFLEEGFNESVGDDKTRMDNTGMIPLLIV